MVSSSQQASDLIGVLRNAALTTDADRLEEVADTFSEHLDHSQEVRNISHLLIQNLLLHQTKFTNTKLTVETKSRNRNFKIM